MYNKSLVFQNHVSLCRFGSKSKVSKRNWTLNYHYHCRNWEKAMLVILEGHFFIIITCSYFQRTLLLFLRHVLASGSVDQTVLIWDLSNGSVASTLKAHKEKIQALQWHPFEAQTLLSGCCDQ